MFVKMQCILIVMFCSYIFVRFVCYVHKNAMQIDCYYWFIQIVIFVCDTMLVSGL
jgi:hypothetical protein